MYPTATMLYTCSPRVSNDSQQLVETERSTRSENNMCISYKCRHSTKRESTRHWLHYYTTRVHRNHEKEEPSTPRQKLSKRNAAVVWTSVKGRK